MARVLSMNKVPEVEVLRNRVEQQSDLIMSLKKRNDDLWDKQQTLQRDLEKARRGSTTNDSKLIRLQTHFDTLSEQHKELIIIKDAHKNANTKLKQEIQHLRGEYERLKKVQVANQSRREETLEMEIKRLNSEVSQANQSIKKANTLIQDLQSKNDKLGKRCESDILRLTEENGKLKKKISEMKKEYEEHWKEFKKEKAATVDELRNDNNTLSTQLNDLRCKSEGLESLAEELSSKKSELERELKELLKKIDSYAYNMTQPGTIEYAFEKLKKEYAAYRTHSAQLLQKEKDMNARLRNLALS